MALPGALSKSDPVGCHPLIQLIRLCHPAPLISKESVLLIALGFLVRIRFTLRSAIRAPEFPM